MRYLAILAIATAVCISVLVSVHREWFSFIDSFEGSDKLAHFVGTGLLSFCMVLGFSSSTAHRRLLSPTATLAAAALLVTLDELLQLGISSRAFDLTDLLSSLLGVLTFGPAAMLLQHIRGRTMLTD